MQGAVKNVRTQFTVPDGLTVVQAPALTPPIFSGEKLVLYGIIAGHGNQNFTGEVELNVIIAGEQVCFKMPFQVCSATVCQAEVNVVHHLAGKALLKEMEQKGKSREDIVKLSVESSVVSSMTAFVAIDEQVILDSYAGIAPYSQWRWSTCGTLLPATSFHVEHLHTGQERSLLSTIVYMRHSMQPTCPQVHFVCTVITATRGFSLHPPTAVRSSTLS